MSEQHDPMIYELLPNKDLMPLGIRILRGQYSIHDTQQTNEPVDVVQYTFLYKGMYAFAVSGSRLSVDPWSVDFDHPVAIEMLKTGQEIANVVYMLGMFGKDEAPPLSESRLRRIIQRLRSQPYFKLPETVRDNIRQTELGLPPMVSQVSRTGAGYVYILKSDAGLYKIGRTVDPADRLRTFSVKLPFRVEYDLLIYSTDHYKLEIDLHNRFAYCHVEGEWFALTERDVEALRREFGND